MLACKWNTDKSWIVSYDPSLSNITRQNILKAGLIIIVSLKKNKKKKGRERERKNSIWYCVFFSMVSMSSDMSGFTGTLLVWEYS